MGSQLLTKAEAAKRLNVTVRTIYKYIKTGVLRTGRIDKQVMVREEDVQSFKRANSEDLPFAINKLTFARLEAEVRTLRREMDIILRLQNLRYERLQLTDLELLSFYRMAEQYSLQGWPPHNEEMLADYFIKIRYDDFENIGRAVKMDHPWKPFFKLVCSMEKAPYNKDLKELLKNGKENVEHIAQVWVELHGGTVRTFDTLVKHGATPLKRLIRDLERQQKPPKPSPYDKP